MTSPDWTEQALHYVAWYFGTRAKQRSDWAKGPATIEQVRDWARVKGLPAPPDERAWGAVTRAAIRQGIIAPTGGYAPARSSNGSPKRLYRMGQP